MSKIVKDIYLDNPVDLFLGAYTPPTLYIAMEDGTAMLLEDGTEILLE